MENSRYKFRAWNGREMRTDFSINSDGTNTANPKWNIMQFTGLKDKNGKEIYDGDYGRYDDDETLIRIRWSEIQARFIMDAFKSGSWLDGFYNFNEVVAQDLEIIGNIYENPNLMKEE